MSAALAPKQAELVPVESQPAGDVNGLALVIERLAANPQVDVAKLEKIIELQERVMAHQAVAAFNAAFAKMQGELPVIENKKKTHNGKYAPLEDILEPIRPILAKFGFALSHRSEWPQVTPPRVRIVGILTHEAGHSRESFFESEGDDSGNKTDIQQLGSTVSYGRRYTTKDLLGIVTRNEDTDGARTQVRPDVKAPQGFESWFGDLSAVADNGHDALQDAWTKSRADYRKHLLATNTAGWEAIKKRAVSAKAGQ